VTTAFEYTTALGRVIVDEQEMSAETLAIEERYIGIAQALAHHGKELGDQLNGEQEYTGLRDLCSEGLTLVRERNVGGVVVVIAVGAVGTKVVPQLLVACTEFIVGTQLQVGKTLMFSTKIRQ